MHLLSKSELVLVPVLAERLEGLVLECLVALWQRAK